MKKINPKKIKPKKIKPKKIKPKKIKPNMFYSKEMIELLKKTPEMSPSTWHKIMNPMCGQCAVERGEQWLQSHS